jgi:hypothetical protein
MLPVVEAKPDKRTGVFTAWLREPNGNLIEVREPFSANADLMDDYR